MAKSLTSNRSKNGAVDMKITTFRTFQKIMAQTISTNDAEALNALRAANAILAKEELTWERVLNKTVNVVNEFEPDPEGEHPTDKRAGMSRKQADENLLDEAERAARGRGAMDFVASVREQFDLRGFMSNRQREALERMSER